MNGELRVGLLGAGMIASYDWGILPGSRYLDGARISAIAAPSRTHSEQLAREYGIAHVHDSLEEMLADECVDAVVNITPIPLHADTSLAILAAGKHLITEKPLASTLADADAIIASAEHRGLVVVSSPPRMLDPARALAKELIAAGAIGTVAFARVRSSHAGPAAQAWPTDPSWFYRVDAGPLMDMGPYGIQEITGILGPAVAVTAMAGRSADQRVVAGGPFAGQVVPVEVDDTVLVLLDLGDATFASVDCTFSVRAAHSPEVEIFGSLGTINLHNTRLEPDRPAVEVYRVDAGGVDGSWSSPIDQEFRDRQVRVGSLRRAILIQHLVDCLRDQVRPVLSAEHARHTLEIILAARQSASTGARVELATSF
jgi:predicted dehydrogenase